MRKFEEYISDLIASTITVDVLLTWGVSLLLVWRINFKSRTDETWTGIINCMWLFLMNITHLWLQVSQANLFSCCICINIDKDSFRGYHNADIYIYILHEIWLLIICKIFYSIILDLFGFLGSICVNKMFELYTKSRAVDQGKNYRCMLSVFGGLRRPRCSWKHMNSTGEWRSHEKLIVLYFGLGPAGQKYSRWMEWG